MVPTLPSGCKLAGIALRRLLRDPIRLRLFLIWARIITSGHVLLGVQQSHLFLLFLQETVERRYIEAPNGAVSTVHVEHPAA